MIGFRDQGLRLNVKNRGSCQMKNLMLLVTFDKRENRGSCQMKNLML